MSSDGLISEQNTSEVKYIGGSYGGNRKAAEKDNNKEALLGNLWMYLTQTQIMCHLKIK